MIDANAFLMGGDKIPSCSFLTIGTVHEGEILDFTTQQQVDDDGKPKVWENNGEPMLQLRVTIQTEENDDEIEDDDGRRRFYLKYKSLEAARKAVKDALTEAGLNPKIGFEVGGWFGMEFVKQDKAASRMKSGTKHFEAWYEPPTEEQRRLNASSKQNEALLDDDDDDEVEEAPKTRGRKSAAKAEPAPKARGRAKAAPEPDDSVSDDDDEVEEAPKTRGRGRASSTAAAKPAARGRGRRAASDDADAF